MFQLKTPQLDSFYSIGHQILSKWYRRNGIFDGVLSTPYHQETMRLISGFESQAATLNNYQLVTNSCKLAIFCSFLLSKLGNKIVNSPKQLRKSISITRCPWSDHEIKFAVFCFATYGQLLQIALSDGNFSSILKLVSYNITTFALAGSVKRQAQRQDRIGYVWFPPSSVCLKSFRYYTRPKRHHLKFFSLFLLSPVCRSFAPLFKK